LVVGGVPWRWAATAVCACACACVRACVRTQARDANTRAGSHTDPAPDAARKARGRVGCAASTLAKQLASIEHGSRPPSFRRASSSRFHCEASTLVKDTDPHSKDTRTSIGERHRPALFYDPAKQQPESPWSGAWPAIRAAWPVAGQISVKYRSNTGQILVKYWSKARGQRAARPPLSPMRQRSAPARWSKYWSNTGQILVKYWSKAPGRCLRPTRQLPAKGAGERSA
jgi:hypothetical protein